MTLVLPAINPSALLCAAEYRRRNAFHRVIHVWLPYGASSLFMRLDDTKRSRSVLFMFSGGFAYRSLPCRTMVSRPWAKI